MNSFSKISPYSDNPPTWNYNNEFVMNGGEILRGITGYDNLTDQYSTYGEASLLEGGSSNKESCDPPSRGANVDDDIRMGMGRLNLEKRKTT